MVIQVVVGQPQSADHRGGDGSRRNVFHCICPLAPSACGRVVVAEINEAVLIQTQLTARVGGVKQDFFHARIFDLVQRIGVGQTVALIHICQRLGFDLHPVGELGICLGLGVIGAELRFDDGVDGAFGNRRDLRPILEGHIGSGACSDERAVAALKIKDLTVVFVEQNKLTRNAVVGLPRRGSSACV